jgi:hypothetical protein
MFARFDLPDALVATLAGLAFVAFTLPFLPTVP